VHSSRYDRCAVKQSSHRLAIRYGNKQELQEVQMGIVMIRCPQTGRDIRTGMTADRNTFEATPVFFARAYCPFCRTEHEWFAQEAWIREEEPQPLTRAVA
jgi:hypothetical protein